MDFRKFKIQGDRMDAVVQRIHKEFGQVRINPSADVQVFLSETYYFRNNSNLMTAVVVTRKDENLLEVEVAAGGGGAGALGLDWGAEGSRAQSVEKKIREISRELNQTFISLFRDD